MKKILILLLISVLFLSGCSSSTEKQWKEYQQKTDVILASLSDDTSLQYAVKQIDGTFYLDFENGNGSLITSCPVHDFLRFQSVRDLQSKLLNNSLNCLQIDQIHDCFEYDENGYFFFDSAVMYEPILPNGYESEYVRLCSGGYTSSLTGSWGRTATFSVYSKLYFEKIFQAEWNDVWKGEKVKPSSDKFVRYTLETDHAYLYVNEQYDAKENGKFEKKPYTTVYGVGTNGSYFVVTFKFKPTVTFLSQLGTTLIEN